MCAVSVPGHVLHDGIGAAMQVGPEPWVALLQRPSSPVRLQRRWAGSVIEYLHHLYIFDGGLVRVLGPVLQLSLDSKLVPK